MNDELCEHCDTPLSRHGQVAPVCALLQEARKDYSEVYDRCDKLESALRGEMGVGDMFNVDEFLGLRKES